MISPLYKLVTEVMFWFVMYVNESIESIHCEHFHFLGSNSVALFTFKNKYSATSSRFGTHIVSTVILTNYEHTHKATRQSVQNRFNWQSNTHTPTPHDTHLLAPSHIYSAKNWALYGYALLWLNTLIVSENWSIRAKSCCFTNLPEWPQVGRLAAAMD